MGVWQDDQGSMFLGDADVTVRRIGRFSRPGGSGCPLELTLHGSQATTTCRRTDTEALTDDCACERRILDEPLSDLVALVLSVRRNCV